MTTTPGRLVVLNGTSSSGKTTLATAFRDDRAREGEFWLVLGIDDMLAKLPVQWLDLGLVDGPGELADRGLRFEQTPNGLRLRVGALCRQLFDTYHEWVATAVRAGLNVLVDEVVVDRETSTGWERALAGLNPIWVGVRCDPEVAEERERNRGDRAIGMASTQHDIVHRHVSYDLEIDTGVVSPDEALAALKKTLGV